MQILVLADLHTFNITTFRATLSRLSGIDIILMAGDVNEAYFLHIHEMFNNVPILAVLGNHDYPDVFTRHPYITNIHGEVAEARVVTVAGIEGSNRYKEANFPSLTQFESMTIANQLKSANILLSHTSPFGIHEKDNDVHGGLLGIKSYLDRAQPRYHIHGHQHHNIQTQYGDTLICCVYGISVIDFSKNTIRNIGEY